MKQLTDKNVRNSRFCFGEKTQLLEIKKATGQSSFGAENMR